MTKTNTAIKAVTDNKNNIESPLTRISSEVSDLAESVNRIKGKVVEFGSDMTQKTTDVVKESPIKSAIGAGIVGFLIGAVVTRFRRSRNR